LVWLRAAGERTSQSLFFLPALFLAAAIGLVQLTVQIDQNGDPTSIEDVLALLDSARSLLGAIAGGIITAAAIVFSFTVLAVQMTASQFSPRTLRGFLGDRVQQVVLGVLIGTVTFCLVALRELRPPVGDGEGFVPDVTTTVAVGLALLSLLAVLAAIDRTARGLRVGAVVGGIRDETLATIRSRFPLEPDDERPISVGGPLVAPSAPPAGIHDGTIVEATTGGWVEQISDDVLAAAAPDGAVIRVLVTVGTYVPVHLPLVAVSTTEDVDHDAMRDGIHIGSQRTMQQDVAFGLVRLGDVALRALSPGINDPHTAEEVIVQVGDVLICLLERPLGESSRQIDGRTLERPAEAGHGALIRAAVEPIRRAAADQPRVLATMARVLGTVAAEVRRRDLPGRCDEIDRQLALIARRASGLDGDAADEVSDAVDQARQADAGPLSTS
jgi:uncharacterized membrane protein